MIVKSNGIPKYIQLKDILLNKIFSEFQAGDKFLTEQELMKTYGVSCATVAHAMKDLTEAGYFRRKRRGGTFVQHPRNRDKDYSLQNKAPLEIFVNGHGTRADKITDPLNWFVKSETGRGIVNSCNGIVRILEDHELINGIKAKVIKDLILASPEQELIDLAKQYNCRHVIIDHDSFYKSRTNSICWEQISGVYELMSWLIHDLGHSKIGLICGEGSYHYNRFAAYQIGLRTYNIPFKDELTVKVDSSEKCINDAVEKLLKLKDRPTAIFVDTDIKAIKVIAALRKHGLRVPEDISIAGFDDIPGIAKLDPPLTTVKAPYYEMGCAGVKMLLKMRDTNSMILPTETLHAKLVIRASCKMINNNG